MVHHKYVCSGNAEVHKLALVNVLCFAGSVIPVTVFVGTLVAVIALLLLSVTAIIVGWCIHSCTVHRWHRQGNQADPENENDYVTNVVTGVTETSCSLEMKVNEAYDTHSGQSGSQEKNVLSDEGTLNEELC